MAPPKSSIICFSLKGSAKGHQEQLPVMFYMVGKRNGMCWTQGKAPACVVPNMTLFPVHPLLSSHFHVSASDVHSNFIGDDVACALRKMIPIPALSFMAPSLATLEAWFMRTSTRLKSCSLFVSVGPAVILNFQFRCPCHFLLFSTPRSPFHCQFGKVKTSCQQFLPKSIFQ